MPTPATRFTVDYIKTAPNGAPGRTRLQSSTTNLANAAARSETAVLAYLRQRHPGFEITILDLSFQDSAGRTV